MQIISLANFKGGTGKTVTAVNLAAGLAREGKRVLLIDADAQHNATDFFISDASDAATLTDLLTGMADPYWPNIVTPSGREGLDLLCADMGLLRLDLNAILTGSDAGRMRLADFLGTVESDDSYDYVLIDCPPSFTAASVAALCNSSDVIIPTRLDAFSRQGALELIDQVKSMGRRISGLRYRVLITMAGTRDRLSKEAEALIRAGSIYETFSTVIHSSVVVGESSWSRTPLYEYAPGNRAAKDYEALLREVLGDGA